MLDICTIKEKYLFKLNFQHLFSFSYIKRSKDYSSLKYGSISTRDLTKKIEKDRKTSRPSLGYSWSLSRFRQI